MVQAFSERFVVVVDVQGLSAKERALVDAAIRAEGAEFTCRGKSLAPVDNPPGVYIVGNRKPVTTNDLLTYIAPKVSTAAGRRLTVWATSLAEGDPAVIVNEP